MSQSVSVLSIRILIQSQYAYSEIRGSSSIIILCYARYEKPPKKTVYKWQKNMWKRIPHLMQQYNTPRKVLTNLVTLLITKKKSKIAMIFFMELENERKKKKKVVKRKADRPRMPGSISVSGQLPTYPSPNPTLTLTC